MRQSLFLLPLMLGVVAAADDGLRIEPYHNSLLVTAPAGSATPPAAILDQRLSVDFQAATIPEVAEFLRRTTGLNVVVMPELPARNATVTLAARDLTLASLLHWIDTVAGIHHGWHHQALWFADQPVVGEPSRRLYDVADLVMPVTNFPGPEMSLGSEGRLQLENSEAPAAAMTTDELADLLRRHLDR